MYIKSNIFAINDIATIFLNMFNYMASALKSINIVGSQVSQW